MKSQSKTPSTNREQLEQSILRQGSQELALLDAVATLSEEIYDPAGLIKTCVFMIFDVSSYRAVMIYLLDADVDKLVLESQRGASDELISSLDRAIDGNYFNELIKDKKPLFIEQLQGDPRWSSTVAVQTGQASSLAAVPLLFQNRLLGILVVAGGEPHSYQQRERTILTLLGKIIGLGVNNARLFGELVRNKNEWGSILDVMTDGISIHDRNFTITKVNQAMASMFGVPKEELVGKKCYQLFHGTEGPIAECPHAKAIRTGKTAYLRLQEPFLGNRIFSVSADPLLDFRGQAVGSVHAVREITEQENAREKLAQYEKFKALGEMASGVTHDFNNYLTVIMGNLEMLLERDDVQNKVRSDLESIQLAARDAAATVKKLQDFTRIKTINSFKPVDVNEVVRRAIEVSRSRWQGRAQAGGLNIEVVTELEQLPQVAADGSELTEVLVNLIDNAVDALPEGGRIELRTAVREGGVEVDVCDNGIGMDDEVCRRVFEPFFTTKGEHSSGLGLSISYGILTRHGGDINVKTKPGEGSTFTLRLPLAASIKAPAAEATLPPEAALRSANVLVIDDELMVRTLLISILESLGHSVQAVAAGSEGVRLVEAQAAGGHPFDVVLSDLSMPEMSGWEVAKRVKQISPETAVALITGWGEQLNQQQIKENKIDAVAAKPFRVEDVRGLISQLLLLRS